MSSKTAKKEQQKSVREFVQFANCSEKAAEACLSHHNWRLEHALDAFYTNPTVWNNLANQQQTPQAQQQMAPVRCDKKRLDKMFEKYKEKNEDKMQASGIISLLNDLGLRPDSVEVLILAWKTHAKAQGEFTREEFAAGMNSLGCDSIDGLRQALQREARALNSNQTELKNMYNFTFDYGKQPNQKNLDLLPAIAYWKMLLRDRFQLLDDWCTYLQKEYGKAISRDTWQLVFDFYQQVNGNLSKYDEGGAWPVVLDDFVGKMKARQQDQAMETTDDNDVGVMN